MQGRGTSTIPIGLDPVHLQTPRLVVHGSVTVVALLVATTSDARRDGVDVCIDSRSHSGEVNIKLHKATEQVVGSFCCCTAIAMDGPTSIFKLGRTVCNCQVTS